ncbi:MAG: hypothetical protein M1331_02760 [Candidatus Marsarchaeota archaeon]|nr:hypothetical protein [Candidatus Marsarchaeota archaeon]MCL5106288.1 hypothetical protein [Candidatus Marsarchaeota archaeon]
MNRHKKIAIGKSVAGVLLVLLILALIFYPIYILIPKLSSNTNLFPGETARFYQNFVYNSSNAIPANCIVFTFDPALFSLNNRTSMQFVNLYNSSLVFNLSKQYSCLVADYGYWCYTQYSYYCANLSQHYEMDPIKIINDNGIKFGFYYIRMKNSSRT